MPFLLISFGGARLEASKCNADERCPLRLDAPDPLFSQWAKCKSSPASATIKTPDFTTKSGVFLIFCRIF